MVGRLQFPTTQNRLPTNRSSAAKKSALQGLWSVSSDGKRVSVLGTERPPPCVGASGREVYVDEEAEDARSAGQGKRSSQSFARRRSAQRSTRAADAERAQVAERRADTAVQHHRHRQLAVGIGPGAGAAEAVMAEGARRRAARGGGAVIAEAPVHRKRHHADRRARSAPPWRGRASPRRAGARR